MRTFRATFIDDSKEDSEVTEIFEVTDEFQPEQTAQNKFLDFVANKLRDNSHLNVLITKRETVA